MTTNRYQPQATYLVSVYGKWGGSRTMLVLARSADAARQKAAERMRLDERIGSVKRKAAL